MGFAVYVIALSIVGELRDIELCALAARRAEDTGSLSHSWAVALKVLYCARRYIFLPCLANNANMLVPIQGADSLSICLNTLAVLFLVSLLCVSPFHCSDRSSRIKRDMTISSVLTTLGGSGQQHVRVRSE